MHYTPPRQIAKICDDGRGSRCAHCEAVLEKLAASHISRALLAAYLRRFPDAEVIDQPPARRLRLIEAG